MSGELDIEVPGALAAYLRERSLIGDDEDPQVKVLAGGVSNRTVLVRRPGRQDWVVKQALAKLRVKVDWFSDPARIHREALGLRRLQELVPQHVPALVFEDTRRHILIMTAVPDPHVNWKDLLLAGRLESDHVRQFASLLGGIHRLSWERRDELLPAFHDRAFFESLRLEPYFQYTAAQVPEAATFLDRLVDQNRRIQFALVHGDYSPKNVLVHQGRLILLDYEVIHFGDPAFDLGFSLAHLLSKAHYLKPMRRQFAGAAADYWTTYHGAIGDVPWRDGLEARAVANALGCLLARVAGRSTLEYMPPDLRRRQQQIVTGLMPSPPSTVASLSQVFIGEP